MSSNSSREFKAYDRTNFVASLLPIFIATFAQGAEIPKAPAESARDACAVRISNQMSGDALSGALFCSGVMVDAYTLVTAAHCLNETAASGLDDLSNLSKSSKLYLSPAGKSGFKKMKVEAGTAAASSPGAMQTKKMRQAFMENPSLAASQSDLVVLRLAEPVQEMQMRNCPRLPDEKDCRAFEQALKDSSASKSLSAHFFKSVYPDKASGSSFKDTDASKPSAFVAKAESAVLSVDPSQSVFSSSFRTNSSILKLRRGDSGTGLIWESATGPVVIGLQSVAKKTDWSTGYFAPLCAHTTAPQYARLAARVIRPDTRATDMNSAYSQGNPAASSK